MQNCHPDIAKRRGNSKHRGLRDFSSRAVVEMTALCKPLCKYLKIIRDGRADGL